MKEMVKDKISKYFNLESVCFVLYCLGILLVTTLHEPWFDELQAWAISKDSIVNILFFLPHYEGHPPLWHLILKIFSSLNFNCEVGIKIPNLLFMYGAVWLLIFKSSFPKIIRLTLPFTYFIFYQYGVIGRPYSIFCFALFLAATLYKTRDAKPFRFMGALVLLCLSSAYGMIFTAGICIAWFINVIKEVSVKKAFCDKRFYSMLILFVLCCVLALEIAPVKDVYALSDVSRNLIKIDYLVKFIYAFGILPADATITNFLNYYIMSVFHVDFKHFLEYSTVPEINSFVCKFWICCALGIAVNIAFVVFFKKVKKLTEFLIPYLFFLIFAFALYLYVHHVGLLFVYLIYMFWCVYSVNNIEFSIKFKKFYICLLVIMMSIQIYWSIVASCMDIKFAYSPQREMVQFIKDQHLRDYRILGTWAAYQQLLSKKTKKLHISHVADSNRLKYFEDEEFLKDYNILTFNYLSHQHISTLLNAYFNENIFYNYNMDNPKREYLFHTTMSKEATNSAFRKLKEMGLPEIVVGNASLDMIFQKEYVLTENYRQMRVFDGATIWKDTLYYSQIPIYMKNDLFYEWIKDNT